MDFPRHDSLQLLYGFLQAAGATGKALAVLQSAKDLPVLQDGPPPGGFPSVRYARRVPSTGPTGFTLFTVGAAVMAFGFYKASSVTAHTYSQLLCQQHASSVTALSISCQASTEILPVFFLLRQLVCLLSARHKSSCTYAVMANRMPGMKACAVELQSIHTA